MFRKLLAAVAFVAILLPVATAQAQFGKNQVMWEKTTWQFYRSDHFDFYASMDISSQEIQPHFAALVEHVERSYDFLSGELTYGLKKRPIVIVSRTHSQFEALRFSEDPFIPEGVGAYAFPRGVQDTDLVLVVKPDFLPVLNRTIITHELTHIFQFDMKGHSLFSRGESQDEGWFYEATADYLANRFAPFSRDDIRKMSQRLAAANANNPRMGLPTLKMLEDGQANPYAEGAMVLEFLEARYGTARVSQLFVDVFKNHKKLLALLADLSEGEFSSHEAFDRAHRDYWTARYAQDSLKRPQPYTDTPSTKGRQIVPFGHPGPFTSPMVSPDGLRVAALTQADNGIALVIMPALPRDDPPYIKHDKQKKSWLFGQETQQEQRKVISLTGQMPPKPYEYIVGQEQDTWPFNGSDLSWWQDADWQKKFSTVTADLASSKKRLTEENAKKAGDRDTKKATALELQITLLEKERTKLANTSNVSRIAFFARKNRDHVLFIIDANTGKFLQQLEVPLDQAFSPVFAPSGGRVYFSAAKNIQRDLYFIELSTKTIRNLTNGGVFNSGPALSSDGTALAYVAFDGDFQKLFLLNVHTGEKTQLTYGRYNDNSPSWSPDGTTLVYTSDEQDGIWNLYTFDLGSRTRKQWTNFYGGVFTPVYAPGENDRIIYAAMFERDQFQNFVYPNIKLFDARLKEPLRIASTQTFAEDMHLALRPQELVGQPLDQRQLEHPQKPPARWKLYGRSIDLGSSTYYGAFGYTRMQVQDILANRTHSILFASTGSFRYLDYSYVDQSRRWLRVANLNYAQYPLNYTLYDYGGRQPRYPAPYGDYDQLTLNNTWAKEYSASTAAAYPFSKWDRIELGVTARKRSYILPYELGPDVPRDQINPTDLQFYDFFTNSSGKAMLGATAAFVHDTVLYSPGIFGPLHGSALRVQLEGGKGLSSSKSYLTASVDARRYQRLSDSIVGAVRLAGMTSNRPNGDFLLLGGSDSLRGYPYFSVAGNQVAYGSAELRLPVADALVLGAIPVRIRGILFGDAAVVRFSQDPFPAHSEWAYGFTLQTWVFLPLNIDCAKTKFDPDHFRWSFRIGLNF